MKLDGKVKGGLAWAGLVVILAVPAANMVVGNPTSGTANSAVTTADAGATKPLLKVPAVAKPAATDPIETASVTTDPVDKLLSKGKKLPSYISDGDSATPTKPAASTTDKPAAPVKLKPISPTTPIKAPTEVATVAPTETPPVPLPRDARPKTTAVASLPAAEKPLILDENKVKQQENAAVEPFPLSDDEVVTGDQLEEWDSGSLADYLERKGLLSQTSAEDSYDPDGFYLDEGPNKKKRPAEDDEFFFF
ncbi:hypothetical protein VW23_004940 [Devosia insulae DS-56]|uniref:Uncharacterized protein n=1 Tax=Devosia insulae DS-56 TaxID=1116389 RepID=A0A1E5XIN8_9HYPH|nr:hypothetical protein [Devosia insulae]OEO28384.1 hypothetical protein VW23_004940 [Devosia insulae DS-56]